MAKENARREGESVLRSSDEAKANPEEGLEIREGLKQKREREWRYHV